MSLLEVLFPKIADSADFVVPEWKNPHEPWSILGGGEFGLISQIVRITGSEDGVYIDPSAIIGDFVEIEGPCFIGPNATVKHSALLRKGSWICEGATVGHSSEVKNSILLPDSKAPHFNYVGDSVVGFGANLGAGVKLSNVRNDRRGVFVSLDGGGRLETGLNKLGAMIGDGSQIGCNTVTNPGAMIAPYSQIGPNETITGWFRS